MDDCVYGTGPLWDCRNVVAESGIVNLVDEDVEESDCLLVQIWLELGLDLDDECRSHSGEQTSLYARSAHSCARDERSSQRSMWYSSLHHAS